MNRLESLICSDKDYVSEQMLHMLESEISTCVKNFVSLSSPVKVRFTKAGEGVKFMVEFESDRIRPLGFIPGKYH